MAMSWLARLAGGAPVPTHCLLGENGREKMHAFQRDGRARLMASPRHATVLLVAGALPPPLHDAARRVHDQLPEPRGVVVWGREEDAGPFDDAVVAQSRENALQAAVRIHRELMVGARRSTGSFGPAQNPVRWKGVGPHGQGGQGMMGGTPYGRPMAMTGPDIRDGLQLDRVSVTLGPFLPFLPPGLCLSLELQGDVIQSLQPEPPVLRRRDVPEVFLRALDEEVAIAQLELARARHHLGATSDLLSTLGLEALARNVLGMAAELQPGDQGRVRRLERRLCRSLALRRATRGIGMMAAHALAGTGPPARAAGAEDDARRGDPAYRALGFAPVRHRDGDAEARWRQRIAEAAQALELAERAGDARRGPDAPLEGPRGPLSWDAGTRALAALADVAPGQAWEAFVTTLVSLDVEHRCQA